MYFKIFQRSSAAILAAGNNPGQYPYGDQNPYGGEEYEDFFNSFPWSYFFGR